MRERERAQGIEPIKNLRTPYRTVREIPSFSTCVVSIDAAATYYYIEIFVLRMNISCNGHPLLPLIIFLLRLLSVIYDSLLIDFDCNRKVIVPSFAPLK